ncbi:MAG: valine--tRNA ligase [Chitinophagaceae bacterium]|nr:valine--tRNA ligase [Chitinophagaceae bacterium]
MSKSLGNSPDLLELIDKYGADACRFGIMISSPAGNDLLWDESSNDQGRNFINKIWNALRLVNIWEGRQSLIEQEPVANNNFAIDWFENRLNESRIEIENLLIDFRLSEALKTIYSLIWDDFCSWYLEWVKPGFEEPIEAMVYNKTAQFFEELMQLLHPFMPFITEEIYHLLKERKEGDDITLKLFPKNILPEPEILKTGLILKEIITAIRDARNKNQLKPKDVIQLYIQSSGEFNSVPVETILLKQVNAAAINNVKDAVPETISLVVQKEKLYIKTEVALNSETQKEQLLKDLTYLKGFLSSVEKKLGNEKFVQNAKPEVIELERRKQSDTETKIKIIEQSLAGLP